MALQSKNMNKGVIDEDDGERMTGAVFQRSLVQNFQTYSEEVREIQKRLKEDIDDEEREDLICDLAFARAQKKRVKTQLEEIAAEEDM